MTTSNKPKKWGVLLLFTTTTTLFCCALPILLVSLGMGTVVVAIYGKYLPWLQWFGLHPFIVFGASAGILAIAGWELYRPNRTCPIDPLFGKQCNAAYKWNVRLLWGSITIWCIGAFAAFIL